jgi:hypothetical protein
VQGKNCSQEAGRRGALIEQDPSSTDDSLFIWVNGRNGRSLRRTGAVIKDGPQVTKTVEYNFYGNPEKPSRVLQFHKFDKVAGENPEAVDKRRKSAWSCENEEIDKLLTFLRGEATRTGRYRPVDLQSPAAELIKAIESSGLDAQGIVDALVEHRDLARIISLIASQSDSGLSAAQLAVLSQRRTLVENLRQLIKDPTATETMVQNLVGRAYWIFGGRYVGVAERRNLTMLDQHDVPLLGADGTLHVVELKGPSIEKLILRHRNHWIVGPLVHEATAQAANYLRDLDEQGLVASSVFANELGQQYDMSRCFATVVIGNSDHHRPTGAKRETVARTLRQYSANLSRIEIITYDQLVESAERALQFETEINATYL